MRLTLTRFEPAFLKRGKKGKKKKTNKHEITLSVDDDAFCHKISHIISKKNKLFFAPHSSF
jgi:hypothetical protein